MISKNKLLNTSFYCSFIYLAISFAILKYVIDLEEISCECSNYWYRDFIKYYTAIIILFIIPYLVNQQKVLKFIYNDISLLFITLLKFIGIFYYVVMVRYFIMLKNTDCKCSVNWKKKLFLYPIIFTSFAIMVIIFFMTKESIKYLIY